LLSPLGAHSEIAHVIINPDTCGYCRNRLGGGCDLRRSGMGESPQQPAQSRTRSRDARYYSN
jgi:hypothetical protein